jgi:hypothetical protein
MYTAQKRGPPTPYKHGSPSKRHHASLDDRSSKSGGNLPKSQSGDMYHLPSIALQHPHLTTFKKAVQDIEHPLSLEMQHFKILAFLLNFCASQADLDPAAIEVAKDTFRRGLAGEVLEADKNQLYTDAKNALMNHNVEPLLRNRVYFPASHLD